MAESDRPWFYHPAPVAAGEDVRLDPEEARHAQGSLRLRPGEGIILADGQGGVAAAEITRVERRRIDVVVRSKELLPSPEPPALWLAPALIRGPRFDTLVEKATELGVAGISPLVTRHTEIRTTAGGEKPERWRRVAITALKQCRRAWLPEITAPGSFDGLVAEAVAGGHRLMVAHPMGVVPREAAPGPQIVENITVVTDSSPGLSGRHYLFVGPEGGWHPEELERLDAAGARRVHLGATRLRAETAALALLGFALVERGQFRSW